MRTKVRRTDTDGDNQGCRTDTDEGIGVRHSDIGLSTNLFFQGGVISAAAVRIPPVATACLKGAAPQRIIEPESAM